MTSYIPGSLPPKPQDDMQPIGWARWYIHLPQNFQPIRLDGNDRLGLARLGDHDRVRFEIAWSTSSPKLKNIENKLRKQARKKVYGDLRRHIYDLLESVPHPIFNPLLHVVDDANQCDRWFGYAPATGRMFDLVYHHENPREDQLFRNVVVPNMVEQPLHEPTWWAMYDMKFIAPVGFLMEKFRLLLGDMHVELYRPEGAIRQPRCSIREIYPADLALSRQSLEEWMKKIVKDQKGFYLPRRRLLFGPRRLLIYPETCTGIGQGVGCVINLRRPLGTVAFQMHRKQRHWLVHDQKRNRLLAVHVAHRPDRMEATLEDILVGLHWGEMTD